eukprot:364189-Chlamydomonas_euryale.AAC.38
MGRVHACKQAHMHTCKHAHMRAGSWIEMERVHACTQACWLANRVGTHARYGHSPSQVPSHGRSPKFSQRPAGLHLLQQAFQLQSGGSGMQGHSGGGGSSALASRMLKFKRN